MSIDIPKDIIPMLELITMSKDRRINLAPYKRDISKYLMRADIDGADLVLLLVKNFNQVELVR
jgi:hypothetical protein